MSRLSVILLHLGYWMLYGLLLATCLLFLAGGGQGAGIFQNGKFMVMVLIFSGLTAVTGFYGFYHFIFPRFLQQKGRLSELKLAGASLLTALACGIVGAQVILLVFGKKYLFNDGWGSATEEVIVMSILALINGIIALVLRGFISWIRENRQKDQLLARTAQMELDLVKAQLNPHFLFNTINNIDVLIEKDPATASRYLNKLSDILRFMLFEKGEEIPLAQELENIEKYLDLQKIRSANPEHAQIIVTGPVSQVTVPPMVFLPFIENAFKHTGNAAEGTGVQVSFNVEKNALRFTCTNPVVARRAATPEPSGLGDGLIRKRLDALYLGRHKLTVTDRDGVYSVQLDLPLHAKHAH